MARNFSGAVMAACCKALAEVLTDAQLQNFFTKFGLLNIYRRLPQGVSKLKRVQEVIAYLDRQERTEKTDVIWDQIVVEGIRLCMEHLNETEPLWKEIEKALRADGYEINNGILTQNLPALPEAAIVQGKLEKKLCELGWEVPLRHYRQARANYLEQQWEAANASIRAFLQGVFDHIAENLPNFLGPKIKPGGARRRFLQEIGFLTREEGVLLQELFNILHTKGAHPGLSDESDCSSRIMIATGCAWRALSRFTRFIRGD